MSETVTTPEVDDEVDEIDGSRMTLSEHLNELRSRLVRSMVVFAVAFSVLYAYRIEVDDFIRRPHEQAKGMLEEVLAERLLERIEGGELEPGEVFEGGKYAVDKEGKLISGEIRARDYDISMQSIEATGNFFFKVKICFLVAIAITFPVALWEIWGFIAAGLYKREKRIAYMLFPPALILFYAGLVFGFLVMVPAALYFTQSDGLGLEKSPMPRVMSIDLYLGFLRGLCLALGLIFQIPIVQLLLARTGIVHPSVFAKYRGHFIVGLLIFAALITPPDPITQVLLAGPAIILWEIGYWVARWTTKSAPDPLELEPA